MKRSLSFLGLLNRAGKTVFGDGVENAIRQGCALILADSDSNQSLRIKAKAENKGALLLTGVSQEELGYALGKPRLTAVLVKDRKASLALAKKWQEEMKEEI